MWEWIRTRVATTLATLGAIIGLRTTESDITLTVQGRWSGKFDPVRLSLSLMVAGMAVLIGICTLLSVDENGTSQPVKGGPYHIPESVPPGQLRPSR